MSLLKTLETTFMRVDLHFFQGHTLFHPSWTLRRQGKRPHYGGEVEGPHTCPPRMGLVNYSSAVTSNIQTYDPHLANKSSHMSQTFNQDHLLDLQYPSR